jgi:peptide/nickel transport system permease protein
MLFARLTRALALATKERLFVENARAIGVSTARIMTKYILPSCLGEILVLAALESARAILTESALSFLGLGIQPPESSWGTILGTGRTYMFVNPWLMTFTGTLIVATTLSINVLVHSYRRHEESLGPYGKRLRRGLLRKRTRVRPQPD